jgi:hypothetical protein
LRFRNGCVDVSYVVVLKASEVVGKEDFIVQLIKNSVASFNISINGTLISTNNTAISLVDSERKDFVIE